MHQTTKYQPLTFLPRHNFFTRDSKTIFKCCSFNSQISHKNAIKQPIKRYKNAKKLLCLIFTQKVRVHFSMRIYCEKVPSTFFFFFEACALKYFFFHLVTKPSISICFHLTPYEMFVIYGPSLLSYMIKTMVEIF